MPDTGSRGQTDLGDVRDALAEELAAEEHARVEEALGAVPVEVRLPPPQHLGGQLLQTHTGRQAWCVWGNDEHMAVFRLPDILLALGQTWMVKRPAACESALAAALAGLVGAQNHRDHHR